MKETNYFHVIYPSPLKKILFFRCKKLMTLKHTLISNEFVATCDENFHVLSAPFLAPVIITHSYKSFIQHINSRPPLLPTCLVCSHYRSNITSVFSKTLEISMHSLVFAFLTGHSCSQILHFADRTMLVLQGTL